KLAAHHAVHATSAVGGAAVAIAVRAATGSPTRTIASPLANLATRAGSFHETASLDLPFAVRARLACPHFIQGEAMPTTFQKRQKEMKRNDKRKLKEEKRAQRKLEKAAQKEAGHSGPEIESLPVEDAPQE